MAQTDDSESPPHKRCLDCGYDLRGLPGNRCPECGREFDPDDPETYLARQRSGRAYFVCSLVAAAVAFTLDIDLLLQVTRATQGSLLPQSLTSPLLVLSLIMALWVLGLGLPALRAPRNSIRDRRLLVTAVILSVAVICAFLIALPLYRVGGSPLWYYSCGSWEVSW